MRSGKLIASNDEFILDMINSDLYDITKEGKIFTRIAKTGKVFVDKNRWRETGYLNSEGYYTITYKRKKLRRNRIIFAKYGDIPLSSDLMINHKDGNKTNDSIDNLELIIQAANVKHMYNELGYKGFKNNAKITQEIADQIRKDKDTGLTHKELCAKYKLSKSTISYIVNNKTWV